MATMYHMYHWPLCITGYKVLLAAWPQCTTRTTGHYVSLVHNGHTVCYWPCRVLLAAITMQRVTGRVVRYWPCSVLLATLAIVYYWLLCVPSHNVFRSVHNVAYYWPKLFYGLNGLDCASVYNMATVHYRPQCTTWQQCTTGHNVQHGRSVLPATMYYMATMYNWPQCTTWQQCTTGRIVSLATTYH